ncbi:MAG: Crp/Fnr family transcriptional regulator [Mobilitalea sp.]
MEENMEKYYPAIKECVLFRRISEKDLPLLLKCLNAQVKSFQEEEYIFFAGDEVHTVGIVLSGVIEIMKESLAGNKHIVAFLEKSDMFAEGIVCTAKNISPVTVRVNKEAKILFVPYEKVINTCGNSCMFHIDLIQNMMMVLGEKNVKLNQKLELLTLKGMREKIASYLLNESLERKSNMFQVVLNRTELADYLNVSRTAMSRELARMKDEGLIDFYGNSFKLINKSSLTECLE